MIKRKKIEEIEEIEETEDVGDIEDKEEIEEIEDIEDKEEIEDIEETEQSEQYKIAITNNPIAQMFSNTSQLRTASEIETKNFLPFFGIGYPVDAQTKKDEQYFCFIQKGDKREILRSSYEISHITSVPMCRYLGTDNHYVNAKRAIEGDQTEKEKNLREKAKEINAKVQEGWQALIWVKSPNFIGYTVLSLFNTSIGYWRPLLVEAEASKGFKAQISVTDHDKNLFVYEKTNRKFLRALEPADYSVKKITSDDKKEMINFGKLYASQIKDFIS